MSWAGVLDDNPFSQKSVFDLFCCELPEDLDIVMLVSIFPVYKANKPPLLQVTICCQI